MKLYSILLTIIFPFMNYFIYHLHRDKSEGWKSRKRQTIHPFLKKFKFIEQIALSLCIAYVLLSFFFLPNTATPFTIVIGTLVSTIGLIILHFGRQEIGVNFSACHTPHLPEKYINTGIYHFLRHPIYLGNILTFLGIIILNLSFITVIGFIILVTFYKIAMIGENRQLKEHFPDYFSNEFIFKTLIDECDFLEFTKKYKESCTKRGLLLNYDPDHKQFQSYDNVTGVYLNNELVAGYVINNYPHRSFLTITADQVEQTLNSLDGSYSEVVAIWHDTQLSRFKFGLKVWPIIVWDTLCLDTKYIFGCSLSSHGLKGLYNLFSPTIVIEGKMKEELTVFYYHWFKFLMTFIAAFVIVIPKTILKAVFKPAKKHHGKV